MKLSLIKERINKFSSSQFKTALLGLLSIMLIGFMFLFNSQQKQIEQLTAQKKKVERLLTLTEFYSIQAKKVWGSKANRCSASMVQLVDTLVANYGDSITTTEQVLAIMTIESGFNIDAKSPTGAHGLMQLVIGTAQLHEKGISVADLDKPLINIRIGIKEYTRLVKIFNGNKMLALLGYNRGPQGASLFPKNISYLKDDYVQKIIESNYTVSQLLERM